MELRHLIEDVQACVGDGEWERAEIYLDDLRRGVHALLSGTTTSPSTAGAIVATMRGIEQSVLRRNAPMAGASLRHLGYCCSANVRTD